MAIDHISRVIYLSKGTRSFTQGDLMHMCARFAANNAQLGVTGVLIRIGNYFVQVIEGETKTIHALLETIEKDGRHECLTILSRHLDKERVFGEWTMNLIDAEARFFVDLVEVANLREQIEDLLAGSEDRKKTVLSTIKQIASYVRSARPRQMA